MHYRRDHVCHHNHGDAIAAMALYIAVWPIALDLCIQEGLWPKLKEIAVQCLEPFTRGRRCALITWE